MAGNSPREAFEAFVAPLRQAVTVVAPAGRGILVASPLPLRADVDHSISFANGDPVRLAGTGLGLEVLHTFWIAEEATERGVYAVNTTSYWYSLLDQQRRELIAYHYHPFGESWCTYPHLHAGSATGIISEKAHLIIGSVTLAAFVRMLIEDPAIPVVSLRPDC